MGMITNSLNWKIARLLANNRTVLMFLLSNDNRNQKHKNHKTNSTAIYSLIDLI